MKKELLLTGLIAGVASLTEATLITDPVAAGSSSGWIAPWGGLQWGTSGGLDPVEGTSQFSSLNWGGGEKGTWKVFDGEAFVEESLQVIYWMGERFDGDGSDGTG